MLTGAALIGEWASGIWISLGSPSTLSALTLSGYASQPNTLGTLNARLGTCFLGSGLNGTGYAYMAQPLLTSAELAIVEGLFLVSWYNQLAFATMGAGGTTIPWARLREGDSSIERSSPVNIGKEYREMAKDANQVLNYLVGAYLDNERGTASSVDYLNPAYPYSANNAFGSNQRSLPGPNFFVGPAP